MNSFIEERDEILKNLDSPDVMIDVMNYCKKYNIQMPSDIEVALAGLHKARLYVINPEITDEMRVNSKLWLINHNYNLDIK